MKILKWIGRFFIALFDVLDSEPRSTGWTRMWDQNFHRKYQRKNWRDI